MAWTWLSADYGSAASAYGPPAVSVPVPVVSSSPLLQPADRPGSEGWESLAVYGLVHSLRDYQKKVGGSVSKCCLLKFCFDSLLAVQCRRPSGSCPKNAGGGE